MKKIVALLTFLAFSAASFAGDMDEYKKDSEAIWRTGSGAQDGSYSAIATSMLGWGLGLSAGIAILCSVLHQSTAGHSHTHCD